jgi:hypothetical protein
LLNYLQDEHVACSIPENAYQLLITQNIKHKLMKEIKKHGLSFVEMESNTEKNDSFNIAKELIENLFFDMAKLSTKYCNDIFCD